MATKLKPVPLDPVPGSKESADSLAVCLAYLEREARKLGFSLTAHIVGVARESLEAEFQGVILGNAASPARSRLEVC